jgi:hypothetical protein
MRKGSKASKKRKADKIFSEKIRAVGMCELAGLDNIKCSEQLQTMHIVGRANHNLRWDSLNAICGCSGHHIYYTAHPTEFAMLFAEHWPDQWAYLQEHRNEIWDKDIDRVLEELSDWRPDASKA